VGRQPALKALPEIRFLFAYNNTNPFCRARPACTLNAAVKKFSGGEDNYDGLDQFLFDCLKRCCIVEFAAASVNPSFCVRLCKASEISENFFAQKWGTMHRAFGAHSARQGRETVK